MTTLIQESVEALQTMFLTFRKTKLKPKGKQQSHLYFTPAWLAAGLNLCRNKPDPAATELHLESILVDPLPHSPNTLICTYVQSVFSALLCFC